MNQGIYTVENGVLRVNFHEGQAKAYFSDKRIVLVLAGTQSGKTTMGPLWLYKEIVDRGPGDYAVVAPTFALMELKAIPEFRRFFEETMRLGKYYQAPIRKFVFSKEGSMRTFGNSGSCAVYFGYAENPDSLESATYKALWADEAGQKRFKLDSWDALQRRLSVNQGRVLITTTPYEFGWLKRRIYDRWVDGDPDIDVVRFESTMNPAFPREEFERQERILPKWKFDMMYRALWTKPAGIIYDCFSDSGCLVDPFVIDRSWPRIVGIDFGQVNTAAAKLAINPKTGVMYVYATYHAGSKSAKDHVRSLVNREPEVPFAVGGASSEGGWRDRFAEAGLPVSQPVISDVEAGIDYVYEAMKTGRLKIFNTLDKLVSDIESYSRVLDADGEPTEQIEDKNSYHRLDALRYAVSEVMAGGFGGPSVVRNPGF